MNEGRSSILVLGGGIAGLEAAVGLAETGFKVHLVEKSDRLGGILLQLDHQFPNDHCGMCRILPMIHRDPSDPFCMKRGFVHEDVSVHLNCQVNRVEGSSGDFSVKLANGGEERTLSHIREIVVATGTGLFDPAMLDVYGFGVLPNVVTALSFERIISGADLVDGRPVRPSDRKPIRRAAFIQCVGSRNVMIGADRCSSACCMFALKEAALFKRLAGEAAEAVIFYMDMRTFGRDFQRYRDRAEQEQGVRLVRCRVHSIEPDEANGDVSIRYVDGAGRAVRETFDLAVLSTGQALGVPIPDFLKEIKDLRGVHILPAAHAFADIEETIIGADATIAAVRKDLQPRRPDTSAENVIEIIQAALVVGGGPAGLGAALALAGQGVRVVLVEKENRLGGNRHRSHDPEMTATVDRMIDEVSAHPGIDIRTESRAVGFEGLPGRFTISISDRAGNTEALHLGAVILATGGRPMETRAYGMGTHERIVTHFHMERLLADPAFTGKPLETVVMIQCAGQREEPRNYCSRTCCLKSIRNAIRVKTLFPKAAVYVFYRDIMTYGASEAVYTEARKMGVLFIPFEKDAKPEVSIEAEGVVVKGVDPYLGEPFRLCPDWLCLSIGVEPEETRDLATLFGIERTRDGFYREADSKWRPLDSGREGVFVCGLGRGPARWDEAVAQGAAAAQRAMRLLIQPMLSAPRLCAKVRHGICARCEMCIPACPYHARYLDPNTGRVEVDPVSCQGCGACVAVCPSGAVVLGPPRVDSVMAALEDAMS